MTPALPFDWSELIMATATVAAAVVAAWMALRGKKGDQSIQQTQGQFDRMLAEITYWKGEAGDARAELEAFRDRQLSRCRAALDGATSTITKLIRYVPPNVRTDAGHELDQIEAHRITDHDLEVEERPPRKDHP